MRRTSGAGIACVALAAASLLVCVVLGCRERAAAGEAQLVTPAPKAATPPAPPEKKLWMVAVGDVMLDRNVGKRIRENGPKSILAKVRKQLNEPNLTFANLECPLSTEGPHDPRNCCFRADPATVKVLTDGGFDVVALANNHSLNAGREGILQTLDVLDKNGIAYVGAQRERTRGMEPVFFHVGELKAGFMAFTDLSFEHGSYSKVNTDPKAAYGAVREAAEQCDLLFVSVHWGEEYESMPRKRQRATAKALIDAGADCVFGHHPHTLQGIGVYKGKPILYSMGNFVFDQREGERMESAIIDLWWSDRGGWRIEATPIWIPRERFGPIYPAAERSLRIARRLGSITKALGTEVRVKGARVEVTIPAPAAGVEGAGRKDPAAGTGAGNHGGEDEPPVGEYKESGGADG
jgi:poly-gamma-glutamate capsule biosynthesis protein CapA/YwtB (metallophosphatase superfamily)